jgi:hypothetical protein
MCVHPPTWPAGLLTGLFLWDSTAIKPPTLPSDGHSANARSRAVSGSLSTGRMLLLSARQSQVRIRPRRRSDTQCVFGVPRFRRRHGALSHLLVQKVTVLACNTREVRHQQARLSEHRGPRDSRLECRLRGQNRTSYEAAMNGRSRG